MMKFFYSKLALDSIRKNKQLYFPYILTCTVMIMMHYIITSLQHSNTVSYMPGSGTIYTTLQFGSWVIAIFAALFLFYTNSFLIRRRKKEFGLLNILGMGKYDICRIIFSETLITALISLAIGLFAGISLSKLAELGLVNIVHGDINYSLSISFSAVLTTAAVFGVIFLLLFINSICQVKVSNAIDLLRSENTGEKPPKANWFFGILGVIILALAYYIAVNVADPVSALIWFFVAVILVILGSYMIFISGSVLFCRILQKNKRYYYKSNHFVSVSSMTYRMKRNGAGLASICILITMVLVMISSTTTLYFGNEDAINTRYPKEINMSFSFLYANEMSEERISGLRETVGKICDEYGADRTNLYDYRYTAITGLLMGNMIETDETKINNFSLDAYSGVVNIYVVSVEDYNKNFGTDYVLGENEALIYSYRTEYSEDTLSFSSGETYTVKGSVDKFFANGNMSADIIPTLAIIVPDFLNTADMLSKLIEEKNNSALQLYWIYSFDTGLDGDSQVSLSSDLNETVREMEINGESSSFGHSIESREANRENFFDLFGSLLFLGITLSLEFIFAAVLIIYYKQISEGYEDRTRFEIMQKVGMTKKEIRKSINSQLLTVFFMPLLFAGLHLLFAFPIICKLLFLFNLNNTTLFAVTTIICFLLFALFYTVVYKLTSNAYYNIVSGVKNKNAK